MGLKEQALLEVMFDAVEALRGFDRLEDRGKKTADTLDKEFDQVDLDALRGEADQLVSKLVELGEKGDASFDELRRSVERAGQELQGGDRAAAELKRELERLRSVQKGIGQERGLGNLERQLSESQARAALLRVELRRVEQAERRTGQAQGSEKLRRELNQTSQRAKLLEERLEQVRREEARLAQSRGVAGLRSQLTAARVAALALVAGLVSATLIVRRFGGAVIEVAREQEAADAKLASAIETLGKQATLTLDALKEQAAGLQQLTAVGDEAVQAVQALIVRVSQLGDEETLGRATRLSLDLAVAMGQDVNSAAQQVSKSLALLSGSTTEVTTAITNLRRAGIILSAQAQERIKSLAAENRTLEAQQVLLDALELRYGGAAAAARDTLGGSIDALRAAFGDLLEVVGESGLSGELRETAERLRVLIEESDELAKTLGVILGGSVKATVGLLEALVDKLEEVRARASLLGAVIDNLAGSEGAAADAAFAFGQALRGPLELLDRFTFLGGATEVALRAVTNSLEDAGNATVEHVELTEEQLEKLVRGYERAGVEIPEFLRGMVERAGLALEDLREQQDATASSVEEFLASFRLAEQEFAEGVATSAEEARAKLHELFTFVKNATGGDLRQATEEQLKALQALAEGVVKSYALAGEAVPEESQRIVDAVEHQLEVLEAARQQEIGLAKAVADAEEDSARRRVKAADDVAKAAGGLELSEAAKEAAEEAGRLEGRLKEVGDELDRLNQQPLDGEQLARYNTLVDESLLLERQLREARRASTEIVQQQGSELDRLSDAERESAEAMADLLRVSKDYEAGSGKLVDRLEEIRIGTLLAGTEQQSFRDQLAGTVEGWEKLTAAQQDQLEQQAIFNAESKRLWTEIADHAETESARVVEAQDRMTASMDRYRESCLNARQCLEDLV